MSSRAAFVKLSKKLSYALRHGPVEMGPIIKTDGFIDVSQLLQHPSFKGVQLPDILALVEENDKKRFEIQTIDDTMFIRAVQGHTISNINDEELLTLITDANQIPLAAHGTFPQFLPGIEANGLCRMKRNHIHIHIATNINPNEVVSGTRKSATVYIVIDVPKAMQDGILFYQSKNGCILSSGVGDTGTIPPTYFKEIISYVPFPNYCLY